MGIARAGARSVPALVLALVLALACGCTAVVEGVARPAPSATGVAAGPRYVDAVQGFTLVPPSGWAARTREAGAAVLFRNDVPDTSPRGRFRANVNVLVRPVDTNLATLVADVRRALPGSLSAYRAYEDEALLLPGGVSAHLLGSGFVDRGTALRNLQVLVVAGDRMAVATGTALADAWPQRARTLDAALRTLTLDP